MTTLRVQGGLLLLSFGLAAKAQSPCGDEVITSSTSSDGDLFGSALTVECDLALVGAPRDDGAGVDAGRVVELQFAGGAWTETASWVALDTMPGDRFGTALALEGTRALVGAQRHGGSGAAYVFELQGSVWNQVQKLTAPAAPIGAFVGSAVGLVGDSALVGAPRDVADEGRVHVFERQAGSWSWTATLASSTSSPGARFGSRIDVEGTRAVIGAPNESLAGPFQKLAGAAYLFDRVGAQWVEAQRLTAPNPQQLKHFGTAVALNGDLLAVGQPALAGPSEIIVFEHDGSGFAAVQTIGGTAMIGSSVAFGQALAWDGDDLFVGDSQFISLGASLGGAVFSLRRTSSGWVSAGLLPHVPVANQGLGVALAVHADGLLAGGASTFIGRDVPGVVKVLAHDLPDVYCTGKIASPGCQPYIYATGQPGASLHLIRANDVVRSTNGLLFYGFDAAAIPFFGGTLCVSPPLTRTPIMNSSGSGDDCSGSFLFDFTAWTGAGGPGQAGDTLYAQYWFRDDNDPDKVGLTDALTFELCP